MASAITEYSWALCHIYQLGKITLNYSIRENRGGNPLKLWVSLFYSYRPFYLYIISLLCSDKISQKWSHANNFEIYVKMNQYWIQRDSRTICWLKICKTREVSYLTYILEKKLACQKPENQVKILTSLVLSQTVLYFYLLQYYHFT